MSKNLKILVGVLLVVALLVIVAVFVFDGKYGSGLMKVPKGTGGTRAAEGILVPCPEDSSKACCEGTVGECRTLCKAEPGGCWRTIPASKELRR